MYEYTSTFPDVDGDAEPFLLGNTGGHASLASKEGAFTKEPILQSRYNPVQKMKVSDMQ